MYMYIRIYIYIYIYICFFKRPSHDMLWPIKKKLGMYDAA